MMRDSATLKQGVHLDLYKELCLIGLFKSMPLVKNIQTFHLTVSQRHLLGKEKIDYGLEFDELTLYQTANYCYNDALLTYELTSFNSDLLMNLLVIIARIGRMPIDDIARMGVSQWIQKFAVLRTQTDRDCLDSKKRGIAKKIRRSNVRCSNQR